MVGTDLALGWATEQFNYFQRSGFMLNSFTGIGRLGKDPDVQQNGNSMVATFDIAINEFYKKSDELQKRTHWIPCITFARLAEISGEFLRKGSLVGVRGALCQREQATDSGKKYKKLLVTVSELEFLSARNEATTEQEEAPF